MPNVVEIEFDYLNRSMRFRPIDRSVRGRFVRIRDKDRNVRAAIELPEEVPPQRIVVDVENRIGYVVELIHEVPEVKAVLAKRGFSFAPEREEFKSIDPHEWLHFMKREVDAGKAKLVSGMFPKTIEYREPRDFRRPEPRGKDRLKQIFYDNPQMAFEYQKMDESQKRSWEQLVGV